MQPASPSEVRPRLLRVSEVARILGARENRVRELIANGQLRSIRLGGKRGWHRVPVEDVERLLAGEDTP